MRCHKLPKKSAVTSGFICMSKLRGKTLCVNSHYPLQTPHRNAAVKGADSQQCGCEKIRVNWCSLGTDHAPRQMQTVVH